MPSIKTIAVIAASVATAVMSLTVGIRAHAGQKSPTNVTVERSETFYRYPEGKLSRVQKSTLAIREDGSNVEIVYGISPDGKNIRQKRIVDATRRVRIVEDELTESLTSYRLDDDAVLQSFLMGAGDCTPSASADRGTRLGYAVHRVTKQLGTDNGVTLRTEAWVAPELNCLALEQTSFATPAGTDKPLKTNFLQVTSVKLGAPSEELFGFRGEFTERAPSAVMAEFQRRYPNAIRNQSVASAITFLDPAYSPPPRR